MILTVLPVPCIGSQPKSAHTLCANATGMKYIINQRSRLCQGPAAMIRNRGRAGSCEIPFESEVNAEGIIIVIENPMLCSGSESLPESADK